MLGVRRARRDMKSPKTEKEVRGNKTAGIKKLVFLWFSTNSQLDFPTFSLSLPSSLSSAGKGRRHQHRSRHHYTIASNDVAILPFHALRLFSQCHHFWLTVMIKMEMGWELGVREFAVWMIKYCVNIICRQLESLLVQLSCILYYVNLEDNTRFRINRFKVQFQSIFLPNVISVDFDISLILDFGIWGPVL